MKTTLTAGLAVGLLAASIGYAQDPLAEEIRNYSRFDDEIAFAGQPAEPVFAKLKQAGFKTVLSLSRPNEISFDEKKVVEDQGMTFVNIPITPSEITDEQVEAFRKVVSDPHNKPLLIHCSSSNRVGAMWYIYRALFDNVSEEESAEEALARGLASPTLEAVVKDYVANRKGKECC